MTHRERVVAALNHQEPDRVPMDLGGTLASTVVGQAYPALRAALGLPAGAGQETLHYASLAEIDGDVREALDVDVVHAPRAFGTAQDVTVLSADRFVDEWGVGWHRPPRGHFYVEQAPFQARAEVSDLERHRWPEGRRCVHLDGFAEKLRRLRRQTDCAISLELRGRVLSMGQFLRGFENWMMDLADNEGFVQALLERTTQVQIEANELLLKEAGDLVDVVYTSDDLGGQNGPLVSPACFRRLLKPHFQRIWQHLRRHSRAKLMHHCCGGIYPFIGDFIELGLEALNPIQVSAADMDPARLKRQFGRDLAFWGGVDTRQVMPRGSVQDVRREVGRRLRQMGRGGGYVLAAVHNLQPEVPPANIIALFGAGAELGRYPLGGCA